MTMLDRVKRMASLVIDVPADIERLSIVIEKKTATAKDALQREAVAAENAVTPELEAAWADLESQLQKHLPSIGALAKAHEDPAPAPAAAQGASAGSDAAPAAPVL